ncbi:MAG: Uncharacterized protein G01um10147_770, partial [Microgenomates group bacterium Gr01-1014_7]
MLELLQLIVISLKVIIPALMLIRRTMIFPLFGLWGNYFLDVIDGDILLSLGMTDATYQLIDK